MSARSDSAKPTIRLWTPRDLNVVAVAFVLIFSQHPFYECFALKNARGMLRTFSRLERTSMFVAENGSKLAGFAVGCPLSHSPEVERIVREKYRPGDLDDALYLAELFVTEPYRNDGLGWRLVLARISEFAKATGKNRFLVVVRLAEGANVCNYDLLGLQPCGRMDVTNMKQRPGEPKRLSSDTRIVHAGWVDVSSFGHGNL